MLLKAQPVALAALCAVQASALAQDAVRYRARDMIGVGAAYQEAEAEVRASIAELPPVKIDLDDFGLDTTHWSWALEARWRFRPRWMLVGLAYAFDEDGQRTAQRDFNYDGKEYQAGASIETSLRLNTYILDVMYSVYATERSEFLIGGGVHAADIEASIRGRAFVGDVEVEGATGSSELLAPLPNLRLSAFYAVTDRLELSLSAGWLSANYGDYEGGFTYAQPRLSYYLAERWMLTVGYQFVDIDITRERSLGRETAFNVGITGPMLMVDYNF